MINLFFFFSVCAGPVPVWWLLPPWIAAVALESFSNGVSYLRARYSSPSLLKGVARTAAKAMLESYDTSVASRKLYRATVGSKLPKWIPFKNLISKLLYRPIKVFINIFY